MTELLRAGALLVTALALVAATVALARTRSVLVALPVLLDLLLGCCGWPSVPRRPRSRRPPHSCSSGAWCRRGCAAPPEPAPRRAAPVS